MLAYSMPGVMEWLVILCLAMLIYGRTDSGEQFFNTVVSKSPLEWIMIGLKCAARAVLQLKKALKDLDESLFR